jgi:hypothetical protein
MEIYQRNCDFKNQSIADITWDGESQDCVADNLNFYDLKLYNKESRKIMDHKLLDH